MNNKNSGVPTVMSLIYGMILGVGIGILLAPKSGEQTRTDIKEKLDDTTEKAKELAKDKSKKAFETIKNFPDKKQDNKFVRLQKQVKGLTDELDSIINSEK